MSSCNICLFFSGSRWTRLWISETRDSWFSSSVKEGGRRYWIRTTVKPVYKTKIRENQMLGTRDWGFLRGIRSCSVYLWLDWVDLKVLLMLLSVTEVIKKHDWSHFKNQKLPSETNRHQKVEVLSKGLVASQLTLLGLHFPFEPVPNTVIGMWPVPDKCLLNKDVNKQLWKKKWPSKSSRQNDDVMKWSQSTAYSEQEQTREQLAIQSGSFISRKEGTSCTRQGINKLYMNSLARVSNIKITPRDSIKDIKGNVHSFSSHVWKPAWEKKGMADKIRKCFCQPIT